ncbi:MAG: hypothetical protein LWX83_16990 [Anaerolineae bacterium]|nr:hypothetical protein [Anaerolineae bacterium]
MPCEEKTVYQIEVRGWLPAYRAPSFEGLQMDYSSAGNTLLTGLIRDQSALFGLLDKIRDLGLELVSLKQIND